MKLILESWRKFVKEESEASNSELVSFIVQSNKIEGYDVSPEEVLEAIEGKEQGYPLRYVTQNPHIFSHLAGLEQAKGGISEISDILHVHRAMGAGALDAGAPGMLRTGGAQSEHGTKYVNPEDIPEALDWWISQDWSGREFQAHTVYELIHPFDDGNGRSGRIILASMLGLNFSVVNSMIGQGYFANLDRAGRHFHGQFWKGTLSEAKEDSKIVAKVILVGEDQKVLFLKRTAYVKKHAGEWDLPGGHVHEGEDILDGLRREVKEETGLSINNVEKVKDVGSKKYYKAELPIGKIKLSSEHSEHKMRQVKNIKNPNKYEKIAQEIFEND